MRPRLLDLFCAAGGAAMGYYRAGFDVVGVDIKPQPRYPFPFLEHDALIVLDELTAGGAIGCDTHNERWYVGDFATVHASPPCQGYVERNKNLETPHPKLIGLIRERLQKLGIHFVIENVTGAARHMVHPVLLCGTMFDLPLLRHRLFETSIPQSLIRPCACRHNGTVAHGDYAAVYAMKGRGPRLGNGKREGPPRGQGPEWADAMGIDWMTREELTQAIPPAYTEYIGRELLRVLAGER